MNGIPRELDWVKERAACTLAKVFAELHAGVTEDVRAANATATSPNQSDFQIVMSDERAFTVRRGDILKPVVTFMLETASIVVNASGSNEEWRYAVGLNNEGRCQLRRDGEEYEQWQVRKLALEGLFFAS